MEAADVGQYKTTGTYFGYTYRAEAHLFMTFTVAQMSASMTPGGITLTKPKSCRRADKYEEGEGTTAL